jgi:hypothetical protein
VLKTAIVVQPKPRRGSSTTSLTKPCEGLHVITSQHSGRPQSSVKGSAKMRFPTKIPKDVTGTAQALAV